MTETPTTSEVLAVLAPFVREADKFDWVDDIGSKKPGGSDITIADCRRARDLYARLSTPAVPETAKVAGEVPTRAQLLEALNAGWRVIGADEFDNDAALDALQNLFRALASTERQAGVPERYRHKKRGTEYEIVGEAEAQIAVDDGNGINCRLFCEGDKLVVYRGHDGKLWCRFPDEFYDGRFEQLPAAPQESAE